jgi:hypothetical protein
MEFAFNKYCPVEFYQPNLPKGKRKLVLLPFYSYKVFAPRPKNSSINLFQKTILGLLNITRLDVNEITKFLDFHKELVKFVISELVNVGFITKERDVTEKGKEALREDLENFSINDTEFITGHIYQNPLSLELYPRFNARIQTVEILDADKSDYPRIEIGTKGEPKKEFVHWGYIRNNLMQPAAPDPIKIIEGVKRHNRAIERNRDNAEEIEVETLTSSQEQKRNELIQKVNIIGEPQKVFLAAFVVYPLEAVSKNSWKVIDPFGLGESPFLKEYIQLLMKDNNKLEDYIDDIWEETTNKRKESGNDIFLLIQEESESEINKRLDVRVKDKEFIEFLLQLEICYQSNNISNKAKSINSLNSIPIHAQKILENIFNSFYKQYPDLYDPNLLKKKVTNDFETNGAYLNSILKKIFPYSSKLHEAFYKLDIQKAIRKYLSQSLRAKIPTTLLACENNHSHPFIKLTEQIPDIFYMIYRISRLRDAEGHAEAIGSEFTNDEATLLQVREDIYKIIKVYLDVIG